MESDSRFKADCAAIRQQKPLIHNITNYVAMNFTANVLLAAGASPLMSFYPAEMDELVSLCRALSVNIGCLDSQLVEASGIAASRAMALRRPWVIDPVGAGATAVRNSVAVELIVKYHPAVIRGNASEILTLASEIAGQECRSAVSCGVESSADSSEAADAAAALALGSGAVVSVSGPVDYITDGKRTVCIEGGSPMMSRITAMGCAATALTAAFLAVDDDPFIAACNAMRMMGRAGAMAEQSSAGTGTFAVKFLDILSDPDLK